MKQFEQNMVDILEINLALESYEDDTKEPMSEEEKKVYSDLKLLRELKKDLPEEEKIKRSSDILSRLNKVLDKVGRDKFIFNDNGSINYIWKHLNELKEERTKKESLTILKMQEEVDNWANQFKDPYLQSRSIASNMTKEVELITKTINHIYSSKERKNYETEKQLKKELGDLLFSLIYLANSESINLLEAFEDKMEESNNDWK